MSAFIQFIWLALRCIAFLWVIIALIILGLFVIGSEGDGYNWGERFILAIKYSAYVSFIFGPLLGFYLSWQSWKVDLRNRKTLSRKDKT